MDGEQRHDGKPYLTALELLKEKEGGPRGGGAKGMVQWLMWYLVRPGGFTGAGGRSQSIDVVLGLTLPQMMFFAYEKSSGKLEGVEAKHEVDKNWSDPEYQKRYSAAAQEAIRKAKEGLR